MGRTGNYLTALPQEIGKLSVLTSLNLRNNKLQLLPPEIG
jgi:Leucine-rich repeat (LRR) protein